MKKLTAILLLFLFLITNSGMAVTIHWCGNKLTSIDFFSADKRLCKCEKPAMKPDCCKDKTTIFTAKTDMAKANQVAFKLTTPIFNFILLKQIEVLPSANFQYFATSFYHPPTFKPKAPIYLLDGVFRI